MRRMTNSQLMQEQAAQTMTYGGSIGAITAWGLSLSDIAAVMGVFIALVGLALQYWAHRRRDRREQEFHEYRLKQLMDREDKEK